MTLASVCLSKALMYAFGYSTDQDFCFPKHIGYQPASIMATIDGQTIPLLLSPGILC